LAIPTYQHTVVVETVTMDVEVEVVVDVVTKNNFGSLHVIITVTSMQIQADYFYNFKAAAGDGGATNLLATAV